MDLGGKQNLECETQVRHLVGSLMCKNDTKLGNLSGLRSVRKSVVFIFGHTRLLTRHFERLKKCKK